MILCSPETERKVIKQLRYKLAGRSCCIMDGGAFLLCSRFSQPGDLVYTIIGCRVPLILRRNVDSQYSIVGPCYHSRYMCGEVLLGKLPAGWKYEFEPYKRMPVFIEKVTSSYLMAGIKVALMIIAARGGTTPNGNQVQREHGVIQGSI